MKTEYKHTFTLEHLNESEITVKTKLHICLEHNTGNDYKQHWDTLKPCPDYWSLSICGEIGNDYVGRCLNEIKNIIPFVFKSDLTKDQINRILYYWEQYHLNDMRPGTKSQTEALDAGFIYNSVLAYAPGTYNHFSHYTQACIYLRSIKTAPWQIGTWLRPGPI